AAGGRPARLVLERDAGRSGLDALHPRLRVGRALGIDPDESPALERFEARAKGVRVLVHLARAILPSMNRDGATGRQEPRDQRVPEQLRRGEVVDLAAKHGSDEERVDQVVRVVDAEEYRAGRRHVDGAAHLDALPEEPEPEASDRPHGGVEWVDPFTIRLHLAAYSSRNRRSVAVNAVGLSTG